MFVGDEPDSSLLYFIGVFSVEPSWETTQLRGSAGRLTETGQLDWHVEVIQLRRRPDDYSSGAAIAVVYLKVGNKEFPNEVDSADLEAAFDLLQTLLAPMEWRSERPLSVRALYAANYTGDGRSRGASVYSNIVWSGASGWLDGDTLEMAAFQAHPGLRLAIRYFTRGLAAAEERFLPDACINYARALECLVGSTSDPGALRRECQRLGLDEASVREFLDKTRNRFAIAHALDKVKAGARKLKEMPTEEIEQDARELARKAISSFLDKLDRADLRSHQVPGVAYRGLPPTTTNLPLPREVLLEKIGPWSRAAPGMAPDERITLAEAARRFDMSASKLARLVRNRLVEGYKHGNRWRVSVASLEMYKALSEEKAWDYRSSTFMRLSDAARAAGIDESELREAIRRRELAGYLSARSMLPRGTVLVHAMRYYTWRRRRALLRPKLYDSFA